MARSVIDVPDLTTDELEALMDTAEDIIEVRPCVRREETGDPVL